VRAPGHLLCSAADVPAGADWLGARERALLARLTIPQRRATWRLGRCCAKAAAAAWTGTDPRRIEVLPARDGAPEVWIDECPVPVSLSLSHRAGRALALVGDGARPLGCDIELVEPRSEAFLRQWLAPAEQQLVAAAADRAERDLLANLIWTAKEAAAKARRGGLRLALGRAIVRLEPRSDGDWSRLQVTWPAGPPDGGWWRVEEGWVMSVAGMTAVSAPRPLIPVAA
jgi:4'-phosphopantetheinyl transferase